MFLVIGCGPSAGPTLVLGEDHAGEYNLGPVEWTGSFTNACEPYPSEIQATEGTFLAGLSNEFAASGAYCDACIEVTTDQGRSAVMRVVTYGVTTAPNNIDVSQAAFDAITLGEYPRTMRWHLVSCSNGGPLYYQFQTGANIWWTSLWVRNPRIAIATVEVQSANHASFFALRRASDGTFNDDGGFGDGPFALRVTAIDGSVAVQSFDTLVPGALIAGTANFP
jgi:expansin (peptidoglycan-binding protein)